jgi:hypothetical protein
VTINPALGPRAKVERAKEHLAVFDAAINDYSNGGHRGITLHDDPDGVRHVVFAEYQPLSPRLSTIAGDVIHNARSALDLLTSHAARLEGNRLQDLGFPIVRLRTDFEAKMLKKFDSSPKVARFLMLVGPYERGGGDPGHHANTLVILNRLSVVDKHQLLILVGLASARAVIEPASGHGEPFVMMPPDAEFLKHGEIIMSISPYDPLFAHKTFRTSITVQIRLSGVDGLPPVGASSILHHVVKIVDRIVAIGERRLFGM